MPTQNSKLKTQNSFRRWLARDWPALVIFALASLLAAYPILAGPATHVVGWLGDNVQYSYMIGWSARALELHQSPFVDPYLNYPGTLLLATTEAPFLLMIAVSPVTMLFGPVLGYNLLLVLAHFLSGYVAYLWILRVTGSRFGGIVAGLAFMFTPFRIAHSYGHLNLIWTPVLPLFFWALDNVLQAAKPSVRGLLLLGVATFLVGCISPTSW